MSKCLIANIFYQTDEIIAETFLYIIFKYLYVKFSLFNTLYGNFEDEPFSLLHE